MTWWEILRYGTIIVGAVLVLIGLRLRPTSSDPDGTPITGGNVEAVSTQLVRAARIGHAGMALVGAGAVASLLTDGREGSWLFNSMAGVLLVLMVTTIMFSYAATSESVAQLNEKLDPRDDAVSEITAVRAARATRHRTRQTLRGRVIVACAIALLGLVFVELVSVVLRSALGG